MKGGMIISDIVRELGIARKTVRKYIHSLNPHPIRPGGKIGKSFICL
ncbi:hypothetical protein B4168_3482 [Anoxybacillus flavithermus]|nr:hypothetical protein B4168_3482 [Anoxybacillus flavithermus]OAO84611.1 hypothetical protein GT23_3462 [Parageobacillus thermoglucosidasius]